MQLCFDPTVAEFLSAVTPTLEQKPETHSFILGLAMDVQTAGKIPVITARLLDDSGKPLVAGLQTEANHPLSISRCGEEIARSFARALAEKIDSLH